MFVVDIKLPESVIFVRWVSVLVSYHGRVSFLSWYELCINVHFSSLHAENSQTKLERWIKFVKRFPINLWVFDKSWHMIQSYSWHFIIELQEIHIYAQTDYEKKNVSVFNSIFHFFEQIVTFDLFQFVLGSFTRLINCSNILWNLTVVFVSSILLILIQVWLSFLHLFMTVLAWKISAGCSIIQTIIMKLLLGKNCDIISSACIKNPWNSSFSIFVDILWTINIIVAHISRSSLLFPLLLGWSSSSNRLAELILGSNLSLVLREIVKHFYVCNYRH